MCSTISEIQSRARASFNKMVPEIVGGYYDITSRYAGRARENPARIIDPDRYGIVPIVSPRTAMKTPPIVVIGDITVHITSEQIIFQKPNEFIVIFEMTLGDAWPANHKDAYILDKVTLFNPDKVHNHEKCLSRRTTADVKLGNITVCMGACSRCKKYLELPQLSPLMSMIKQKIVIIHQ